MITDNVAHLPAQEDACPPRHLDRDVAVAAVHALLAALLKAAPEQPVKLALELPGLREARLILESLPDAIEPDDVMEAAMAQASAERLELVYELFGDRLRCADDHADALLERGDTAIAAAYLPLLLSRLRRPVELFQKLLERGDDALFLQLVEHQAHCCFDTGDLESLRELADEAANRHREVRPSAGAEAVARAAALHAAAVRLRDAVSLRQF